MTKLETRDGELWLVAPWDDEGKKVIAGWESMTGWYWFATEIEDEIGPEGKPRYFGYVQGSYPEWGSFSQAELDSTNLVWKIKDIDLPYAGRRSRKSAKAEGASKRRKYQITPPKPGRIKGNYDPRFKPSPFNRKTRAARGAGQFRKFGGQRFTIYDGLVMNHKRPTPRPAGKAAARQVAAHVRQFGNNARVVPVKGGYAIYSRRRSA